MFEGKPVTVHHFAKLKLKLGDVVFVVDDVRDVREGRAERAARSPLWLAGICIVL